MGTFALISMPVDLTRRGMAEEVARELLETFPGTRNTSVDGAAGTATFEILFPGNLSALVARLRSNHIPVGDRASVTVPVRPFSPDETVDPERLSRAAEEGPEIWDVQFRRGHYVFDARATSDCVQASIVPSSNSMHQLYDALLHLGIAAEGDVAAAGSL